MTHITPTLVDEIGLYIVRRSYIKNTHGEKGEVVAAISSDGEII